MLFLLHIFSIIDFYRKKINIGLFLLKKLKREFNGKVNLFRIKIYLHKNE